MKADNQLKAEENKLRLVDVSKKLDEQMTRATRAEARGTELSARNCNRAVMS